MAGTKDPTQGHVKTPLEQIIRTEHVTHLLWHGLLDLKPSAIVCTCKLTPHADRRRRAAASIELFLVFLQINVVLVFVLVLVLVHGIGVITCAMHQQHAASQMSVGSSRGTTASARLKRGKMGDKACYGLGDSVSPNSPSHGLTTCSRAINSPEPPQPTLTELNHDGDGKAIIPETDVQTLRLHPE